MAIIYPLHNLPIAMRHNMYGQQGQPHSGCPCRKRYAKRNAKPMKVLTIILCLLVTSCITVAPIVSPYSRIDIYGVSSLPPQNGQWSVIVASGTQMSLAKSGGIDNESLVVQVSTFQLPEFEKDEDFLTYVQQGRASEPDTGRFRVIENEESLSILDDATCVKYHSVSEDNAAQIKGGNVASMLLENMGYNCQHPLNKLVGVHIEYSLRRYPDTVYSSFESDANGFFGNIGFTSF
jgi:hypothetical protein